MKKSIIICAVLISSFLSAYSQENSLPDTIRNSFLRDFPAASDMAWSDEGHGSYGATFTFNNKRHQISYDSTAHVTMHRFAMDKTEYPLNVVNTIKSKFPNYKIEDIDYVEKAGVITYEAELEGKPDLEVYFDAKGELLRVDKERL